MECLSTDPANRSVAFGRERDSDKVKFCIDLKHNNFGI